MFRAPDTHTGACPGHDRAGPAMLPSRSPRLDPLRRVFIFCVVSLTLAALLV